MNCQCCGFNPIESKRRPLCKRCYYDAHKTGSLKDYPLIASVGLRERLSRKHPGIIDDLQSLVDRKIPLRSVGEKHNLTKERIRQIFELLYGFKYTVITKKHSNERRERIALARIAKRDPRGKIERYVDGSLVKRGADAEKKVLDICHTLGYEVKPYLSGPTVDLVINDYNVEVKSSYKTCLTRSDGKTPLYHFQLSKSQNTVDFVVCYIAPLNKFFVIPRSKYPKHRHLYIPEKPRMEWGTGRSKRIAISKYYKFLEAWHLLKRRSKDEFVFSSLPAQAVAI